MVFEEEPPAESAAYDVVEYGNQLRQLAALVPISIEGPWRRFGRLDVDRQSVVRVVRRFSAEYQRTQFGDGFGLRQDLH